jgi:hypothetical protein
MTLTIPVISSGCLISTTGIPCPTTDLKNLSGRRKKHHLTKRCASSIARRSVLKRISQKYTNVVTAVVVIQEISPFGKMQARKLFRKLPGRRVLERQHRRGMREITGSPHPLSSPPVTLLAILSSLTPSLGPIVLQDRRLLRHLGSCREKPANIHQLLH